MSAGGPVPVTLLGGFLGAGKTTLLNHLLHTLEGRRVCVVVNDFGDLNIDADLVESVEGGVTQLQGGCMCCAIRGSAVSTVLALAERDPPPEHVVIEASGASDVGALRDAFRAMERHQTVRLDGLVVLVDAERFDPDEPDLGPLFRSQTRAADLVVLNKADLVGDARLAEVEARITDLAPNARRWTTAQARVPEAVLLGLPDAGLSGEPAPPADALLESRVVELPGPVPGRPLVAALARLPEGVYRAKGFVRLQERPDDRVLVQVVGPRVHVRTVGAWPGEARPSLVLIAKKGADWEEIRAVLDL